MLATLLAGAAAYTPTHLRGVLTVAKAQLVEQQREELLDRQEGIGSLLEYGKPFAYYYRILEKQRRRAEAVTELLNDVSLVEREIDGLMERLEYGEDPEQILKHVEGDALLGRVLDEFSPATYARATEPVGARPYGFDGLVLSSPRGIPILVGRFDGATDSAMLACAAEGDSYFRVRDGKGANVLLRTSWVPGLKGSKACASFAADVAAWFSDSRYGAEVDAGDDGDGWFEGLDVVEVLITDAAKLARRGKPKNKMKPDKGKRTFKDKEKLGVLRARPANVAADAEAWELATEVPCWKLSLQYPAMRSRSPRRRAH